MAVFKCKMCGGAIDYEPGSTVGICDSCGTKQTLPNVRDDAIGSLYNRANTLRMKSEFDRAEEIYNKIISTDETQAEAYWGIILCKFGIEYVEDPATFKQVPTCHRTSYDAITADEDFKLAVKYGDAEQKKLYKEEAKTIDAIQKDILNIAKNEKPFDVFLCYKETDESGKRTQDSVIANDIYYQLTQEGFKVFYAAITLEDKIGQEYEPYIFAALNSAKVMLVVGSKPEYFTSVWVKNEWSRFLKVMKRDRSKLLIPCYKDMDAYELPDEFAHLQAQDMSKIGFINDVVRGIKKVIVKETEVKIKPVIKENTADKSTAIVANVVALKKRGNMALEDGEWQKADTFFEEALNQNAEDSECYLGKLMAEMHVKKVDQLNNCGQPLSVNSNYQKAIRFGDKELANTLKKINDVNESSRVKNAYSTAKACMEKGTVSDYEEAVRLFKTISDLEDAEEQIDVCTQKIREIKRKEEKNRISAKKKVKRKKVILFVVLPIIIVLSLFFSSNPDFVSILAAQYQTKTFEDILSSGKYSYISVDNIEYYKSSSISDNTQYWVKTINLSADLDCSSIPDYAIERTLKDLRNQLNQETYYIWFTTRVDFDLSISYSVNVTYNDGVVYTYDGISIKS